VQEDGHEADVPLHTYGEQLGLPVEPEDMLVQVPREPARLQASQAPEQAVLQHTPSTQLPLAHWVPAAHAVPLGWSATQTPPLQLEPVTHWVLEVQLVGQLLDVPLHRYGEQLGLPVEPDDMLVQVPSEPVRLQASHAPEQAVLQQRPSTQLPEVHWLAPVQVAPLVCFTTQVPPLQ
jgi:hypothetical protein